MEKPVYLTPQQRVEYKALMDTLRSEHKYSWRKISKAAGYRGIGAARTAYVAGGAAETQYLENLRAHIKSLRGKGSKANPTSEPPPQAQVKKPTATPSSSMQTGEGTQSEGPPQAKAGLSNAAPSLHHEIALIRRSLWSAASEVEGMLQKGVPGFVRAGLEETRGRIYDSLEFLGE